MLFSNRQARFDELYNLGYTTGSLEDKLYSWLKTQGYTSGSLEELLIEWLNAIDYTTGSLPDRLQNYLTDLQYTGSLSDKLLQPCLLADLFFSINFDSYIDRSVANVIPSGGNDFWVLIEGQLTWNSGAHSVLLRAAGGTDEFRVYVDSTTGQINIKDQVDGAANYVGISGASLQFTDGVSKQFKAVVAKSASTGLRRTADGGSVETSAALTGAYDSLTGNINIGHYSEGSITTGQLLIKVISGQISDANMVAITNGTKILSDII